MDEAWKQLDPDLALHPAWIRWDPDKSHRLEARSWQATPSIAMHQNRLWISWNAGIGAEKVDNYIVVKYSDDLGKTWCQSDLIIDLERRRMGVYLRKSEVGKTSLFCAATSLSWHDDDQTYCV